jgi:hypothetical protein
MGVHWGYAQVQTITSTASVAIPAAGALLAGGQRRSSGQLLIQPIDGAVRYAFDTDPDDADAAAIGQDVQLRDNINNAVHLVRDADEGADVQVLVCYEVQ